MLTFIISDNNVHYYVLSLTHIIFDMDASLNKRITHFPATREPVGLVIRSDEKRPDGVTFIPWEGGMCLTWDAIVSSTPWQSFVHSSTKAYLLPSSVSTHLLFMALLALT